MSECSLSAVTLDGLSLIDSAVDFTDLAFLDLVAYLQDADRALCDKLRNVRALSKDKKALLDEIARLERAIRESGAEKDSDVVNVPGGLPGSEGRSGRACGAASSSTAQGGAESGRVVSYTLWPRDQRGGVDAGYGARQQPLGMAPASGEPLPPANSRPVSPASNGAERQVTAAADAVDLKTLPEPATKAEVEAAIEELRTKVEAMNTSSSLAMMDLQMLMAKRDEAVQFVSKVISSSHQTAMAIINNVA